MLEWLLVLQMLDIRPQNVYNLRIFEYVYINIQVYIACLQMYSYSHMLLHTYILAFNILSHISAYLYLIIHVYTYIYLQSYTFIIQIYVQQYQYLPLHLPLHEFIYAYLLIEKVLSSFKLVLLLVQLLVGG